MNNKTRHEIASELNKIVGYADLLTCNSIECTTRCQQIKESVYHVDALMVKVERRRSQDTLTSYSIDKIGEIGKILNGKNVMIVDGIIETQDMLRNIFSLFKCNVKCVSSGVEALQEYASYKPDIVCLDIVVPGIQGDEVAKSLKAINSNIKFIAVSALKKYTAEQISAFDALLSKPFTIDQVLDTINQCHLTSLESDNNPYLEKMDFSDLSEEEKKEIIKTAKNGAITELKLTINNLKETKIKEWLEIQLSKMNLDVIMMNLK